MTRLLGRGALHSHSTEPHATMWMAWGTAWASHLCVYTMSLSLLTRWPLPRMRKRVVMRPSTPTGPRAWMRDVLMPTCHPHPSGRHAAAGRIDLTLLPAALRQACGCSSRSCSAQREIDWSHQPNGLC